MIEGLAQYLVAGFWAALVMAFGWLYSRHRKARRLEKEKILNVVLDDITGREKAVDAMDLEPLLERFNTIKGSKRDDH
jgi:hypothetical protein